MISSCPKFLELSVRERIDATKRATLCLNCLGSDHFANNCKHGKCKKCHRRHHTLLHFPSGSRNIIPEAKEAAPDAAPSEGVIKTTLSVTVEGEVLLGTAVIKVKGRDGNENLCRVLLDSGSQAHVMTEGFADVLQLEKHDIDLSFSGLSRVETRAKHYVHTVIKSRVGTFEAQVTFVTLPAITGFLPVSYRLLRAEQIELCEGSIILQGTHLGWLVTGSDDWQRRFSRVDSVRTCHLVTSLEKCLRQFWEFEEVASKPLLSSEELEYERHFVNHTSRDSSGCYIVSLLFNERKDHIGESRRAALKRFYALERRLGRVQI